MIDEEETSGERIADLVARFGGSWTFIIAFGITLTVYTTINVFLRGKAWDPYPFILLNLFLSMLAAIQAPVIMVSQNRRDTKDRVRSEHDFEVNVRSESEIQGAGEQVEPVNGEDRRSGRPFPVRGTARGPVILVTTLPFNAITLQPD